MTLGIAWKLSNALENSSVHTPENCGENAYRRLDANRTFSINFSVILTIEN